MPKTVVMRKTGDTEFLAEKEKEKDQKGPCEIRTSGSDFYMTKKKKHTRFFECPRRKSNPND